MNVPSGSVQTKRPGSQNPYGIPWANVSRWEPAFTNAGAEFGVDPALIAVMAVIESNANQYQGGKTTGTRADVIVRDDGFGDGLSVGMLQPKPGIWQSLAPDADAYTPTGNIRLGAAIMASAIKQRGSWEQAIRLTYFPANDPNGTTQNAYVETVRSLMKEMSSVSSTMVRFAGTSVDVPLDVPFRKVILPASQTRQRPGIFMDAAVYVQHETGNVNAGANADMHLRYLQNGAEGQQLGYHFTVDEKEAIQMIPVNEVTWHGGDGGGQCNYTGVSCELCVQDNNSHKAQARENAEKLAAAVMLATNVTRLIQHSDCCAAIGNPAGCHSNCPQYIRQDHYWPTFVSHVESHMSGTSPAPIVVYAPVQPPPAWDGSDVVIGNATFRAAQRKYTAKTDGAKLRQWADLKSAEVREPLKKGESIVGLFLVTGGDGQPWIVTNYGSRARAEDFTPRVTIQDS